MAPRPDIQVGVNSARVTVLIAEDNPIFAEGLQAVLADDPRLTVVGVENDRDAAVAAAVSLQPDVLLSDLRMPPTFSDEGLQVADVLRTRAPRTGVVLLSQHTDLRVAHEFLAGRAEGRGYLLKDGLGTSQTLVNAVHAVASGGTAVDPSLVDSLMRAAGAEGEGPLAALTAREIDVLRLLAEGLNNVAIAERLNLSLPSVEKRLTSLFKKLPIGETGENKRVSAVLIYLAAVRDGEATP